MPEAKSIWGVFFILTCPCKVLTFIDGDTNPLLWHAKKRPKGRKSLRVAEHEVSSSAVCFQVPEIHTGPVCGE